VSEVVTDDVARLVVGVLVVADVLALAEVGCRQKRSCCLSAREELTSPKVHYSSPNLSRICFQGIIKYNVMKVPFNPNPNPNPNPSD